MYKVVLKKFYCNYKIKYAVKIFSSQKEFIMLTMINKIFLRLKILTFF